MWAALLLIVGAVSAGTSVPGWAQPPSVILIPRGDFHYASAELDAEMSRLDRRVDEAFARYGASLREAYNALGAARGAPVGSPQWVQARSLVRTVVGNRDMLSAILSERIAFYDRTLRSVSQEEVPLVMELKRNSENELLTSGERVQFLLRTLTQLDD